VSDAFPMKEEEEEDSLVLIIHHHGNPRYQVSDAFPMKEEEDSLVLIIHHHGNPRYQVISYERIRIFSCFDNTSSWQPSVSGEFL
jgi:hypothetical protein